MSETIWEEPPTTHGNAKWIHILTPLMEHPGRWARIAETRGAAGNLKQADRNNMAIPPGQWEFRSSQGKSYARYIGPDDA